MAEAKYNLNLILLMIETLIGVNKKSVLSDDVLSVHLANKCINKRLNQSF